MKSIQFPNMFSSTKLNTVSDREATIQNTKLILKSVKNTLFGDPFFGNNLIQGLYEFNGSPLIELVQDEIYTTLITFIPQLDISRDGITFVVDHNILYVNITARNMPTFTLDLFELGLTVDRKN